MNDDIVFMALAIEQAKIALAKRNFPCGAVLVEGSTVISSAHNEVYLGKSAINHAEILCLEKAQEQRDLKNSIHLSSCTLYTTVEPCLMCAGAMQQIEIDRVVFGVSVEGHNYSSTLKKLKLYDFMLNFKFSGGILGEECKSLLVEWFNLKMRVTNEIRSGQKTVEEVMQNEGLNLLHLKSWGIVRAK